jgi:hypothetical protein
MFVEVFGLTKWGSGESATQNYSSIGSALVMLSFMSVGFVYLILSVCHIANYLWTLERDGTNICTTS